MDYNIGIVCDVIMVKVNKHILSSPKFPCTHLGGWCIRACMYACVCCVLFTVPSAIVSYKQLSISLTFSKSHSTLCL